MDKVLIISDNLDFLNELKKGLNPYKSQFDLLIVSNVKEAVRILRTEPIGALVTELEMPGIDALSILTFMSNNFSQVPCIAIIEEGRPKIWIDPNEECVFNYIEKPIVFDELANVIVTALDQYDECTPLTENMGLSPGILLQLIENENKTRLVEIYSQDNRRGYFYFNNGVLYNAVCGELRGEAAALEMLHWKRVKILFKSLPKEKIKRQIHTEVFKILLDDDQSTGEHEEPRQEPAPGAADERTEEYEIEMEEEGLEEISPEDWVVDSGNEEDEERRRLQMALNDEVFEPLKKISGFIGAEIYSGTGEVLLAQAPETINVDEVGGLAIELYKNARAIAEQMKMGIADLVEVRTESHYFLHACIVPGKGALGVLMKRDGNVGLMRHTMRGISESLISDFS